MKTKLEIEIEEPPMFSLSRTAEEAHQRDRAEAFADIATRLPEETHGQGQIGKLKYVWRVWLSR